jgi:hypothetical protein
MRSLVVRRRRRRRRRRGDVDASSDAGGEVEKGMVDAVIRAQSRSPGRRDR